MGLTAISLESDGLSDAKLLSQMCGNLKMNLSRPGTDLVFGTIA